MLKILSERVKLKLLEISDYTLEIWGENQRSIYLNSIHQKFDKIATLPHLGRFLFAQNGVEFRKMVHRKHIILYFFTKEIVYIYNVQSQYQNLK